MKLDITLKRSAKAKHGLLLTITKPGDGVRPSIPFVYAKPLDKPHAKAIAKRRLKALEAGEPDPMEVHF